MSELDPDFQAELDRAPPIPTVQTSRLAIIGAIAVTMCLPGVSGLLGLVLGLLALRQVNSTSTIQGANLAWFAIMGGLFNLLGWGTVGLHVLKVREQINTPTQAFLQAWMNSEADGEAAVAPGLRPLMRHGEGELQRTALRERFGPFRALGPRTAFDYNIDMKGEHISAAYTLQFQNGAPCNASFEYVTSDKQLMVVGYKLESPLLHDLAANGQDQLHGQATPDLASYGEPGAGGDRGSHVKSYNKH